MLMHFRHRFSAFLSLPTRPPYRARAVKFRSDIYLCLVFREILRSTRTVALIEDNARYLLLSSCMENSLVGEKEMQQSVSREPWPFV